MRLGPAMDKPRGLQKVPKDNGDSVLLEVLSRLNEVWESFCAQIRGSSYQGCYSYFQAVALFLILQVTAKHVALQFGCLCWL